MKCGVLSLIPKVKPGWEALPNIHVDFDVSIDPIYRSTYAPTTYIHSGDLSHRHRCSYWVSGLQQDAEAIVNFDELYAADRCSSNG